MGCRRANRCVGLRISLGNYRNFYMASWQRSHSCGELRETHIGQSVTLNGWVNTYRAYNDQIFLDVRDRYGITQVVIEADHPTAFKLAQDIRSEWVISATGK